MRGDSPLREKPEHSSLGATAIPEPGVIQQLENKNWQRGGEEIVMGNPARPRMQQQQLHVGIKQKQLEEMICLAFFIYLLQVSQDWLEKAVPHWHRHSYSSECFPRICFSSFLTLN